MTGYLLTIISIVFYLCCQLEISYSQFNLYNTEEESLMMNVFGHHCLYHYQIHKQDAENTLIPYCIRPETLKELNDEYKSCYGEIITFKQLKLTNVSIADLFRWNAVIEIIDLYEKYLVMPNVINDTELYCKCSSLIQFGKSCQYTFNYIDPYDNKRSLTNLILKTVKPRRKNEEMKIEYVTCYIGIQCENNLLCLDWRQICNGIVDCDHGEDEPLDLCLQIESSECNAETEFRCKDGFCIPKSFQYDTVEDCPDESDELPSVSLSDLCFQRTYYFCEKSNCGWKQFSCGDGSCIPYSDLTSNVDEKAKTCSNQRDFMYLKQLFYSHNENQCWKSMICLTGYDYLYSNISCLNKTIEIIHIEQYCPNEYYFPSNSIIYSFVFFLYEKLNRTNWFNYTGPNYICYDKQYCNKDILILPRILKNNLICFYVNQTTFSWKNFSEYIIYLFHSCYSNYQTSLLNNNKMLYKCNLSDTFMSIYRVKDKKNDCFFNEDEDSNINLCSLNLTNHFKCLTNENECIHRAFLMDHEYDCSDGSDEYVQFDYHDLQEPLSSHFFIQRELDPRRIYRFEELCDQVVNYHIFSVKTNETDETDCEYWPLTCDNSPYTKCNKIWNCKNGLDEINCPFEPFSDVIRYSFHCNNNEHYCLQLINNNNDINMTCLHLNRTGDGIIDCIGGTDERLTNICQETYPFDLRKRFYCMNSSICIKPDQVCDTIINCPFKDDEQICPWLFKTNSSKFYCQNSSLHTINRCNEFENYNRNCQLKEQSWFCDLEIKNERSANFRQISFELYPKTNQKMKSISFENVDSNKFLLSETQTLSSINTNIDMWLCNQGYPIQSLISKNKLYCLCSSSFYGNYCQYQSEHLKFTLKIQTSHYFNPLTVFRLLIYLLNENNVTISHDEIVYNHRIFPSPKKYLVYLMYERIRNITLYQRSKSKFIRIDSYIIKETNIQYISSSLFHVSYPFLPVNRLTTILFLEILKISNCKKQCGSHGKCMYYQNLKNIEYCWCNQGWFGEKCHLKSSSNLCNETSCAAYSQCVILNNEKKQFKCICPLGKSGNQCYIKYNSCYNILCQNNGTCVPLDQRILSYKCICEDGYEGSNCEYPVRFSYISIPANISYLTEIPAIVIIFGSQSGNLIQQERRLYKNVLLPTTLKMSGSLEFGFIQMFYNLSKNDYYMIALQKFSYVALNTSVIHSNLCKNISEIFNETILYEYSYLKRLKLYHLPCNKNKDLRCFFDEYRMCFCTQDHNSHCYLFEHEYSNCNYCLNGGLCLQRNPIENQWDSICLCPTCSFGNLCEFSTENYFITLDMLIGSEMKRGDLSFIIYSTLIILLIILIFNIIFNTISLIIFLNKKTRQVGCDLYLLYLTITCEIGLILLFLRYLYMIIIQIYIIENELFIKISCIFLEYSVRLIPSLFDWLTVCISIERTYTVIKSIHFTKRFALKTLKLSRWIIPSVFLFNILTTLHRPFYLILVGEPILNNEKSDHPWCVLDFQLTSWNMYEKLINIFHLSFPLILNLISIIYFLFYKTKFELTSTVRIPGTSTFVIIKEQLLKYKPLLISTIIIIILEIPRFILTFTLACIKYKWQKYVYLTGYLISFLPLTGILFIYILPSPKYKEQLRTILKNKFHIPFFRNLQEN